MEYTDSLWAHLGGDTDVSTQSEVDQWLEEALDEAEDDNLDTEGVDNEPISETTWNAAARHITRREAIMRRTATGEPNWIEAARRIVANKQYESVDGVLFDGFSASAVLQIWEALNDENKERYGKLSLPTAVSVAFKLMKSPAVSVSRKQANAGLTCPTCGEPVEPTPSGMYSHVNSLTGPCGIRIMDTAQRPDGTFTDEDDLVDQGLADPDMYDFSGYEGSRSAMVTPMSRKQAAGPYYVAVDRLEDGSRTYKGPYSDTAAAQREADAWNNAESSYEGRSWISIVVSGPEAEADFKAWQKATKKGQPWEDQKRYFPNTAARKQAVEVGDAVRFEGETWYVSNEDDTGKIAITPASENGMPIDSQMGTGRWVQPSEVEVVVPRSEHPMFASRRRIALSQDEYDKWFQAGMNGDPKPTDPDQLSAWEDGKDNQREIKRTYSTRTAATEGDMSTCRICGRAMQLFDNAWYAIRLSRPQRAAPDHYHVAASPGRERPGEFNVDGTLNPGSPGGQGGQYDAPAGTIFDNGGNPIMVASRRTAVDEAVEHDDIETVEGTGEDDEDELYDDWAHDDNGYDPSVDDPDRWRWQSGQTGVSSFATKVAAEGPPHNPDVPLWECPCLECTKLDWEASTGYVGEDDRSLSQFRKDNYPEHYSARTALTSVDDAELIDWDRRREEEAALVEHEPRKHIYSDSQRRSR